MATVNDYCQQRLLIAGPKAELRKFDRHADGTEIPGATDFAMLEHSATRRVWQFVTKAPALKFLRGVSRRWPTLVFLLHYDCEDQGLVGMVRAKHGRLRQHRFKA